MPDMSKFSSTVRNKLIPFLQTKNGKITAYVIAAVLALLLIMHGVGSSGGHNTIDGVATEQLKDIQNGDIDKAYALTSSTFQQKNSLDVFSGYVQGNQILKQNPSVNFTENKVDNGVGDLKATLTGSDNSTAEVEWQLVQENNQWKVQVFQVNNPQVSAGAATVAAGASDSSGAVIHDLLIGDQADLDGYVDSAKLTLPPSAQKIYVTAEIVIPANSTGNKIQAVLHMPGSSSGSPQTSDVTGTGNILKPFAFNRSGSTWPTGDYSITVTLSTGATLTQKFKVE